LICLIASSYINARKWAASQHLKDSEWFYPDDAAALFTKSNFHVIVVEYGLEHVSNAHLNQMITLAQKQGAIDRKW
jgi:hypothetical protein